MYVEATARPGANLVTAVEAVRARARDAQEGAHRGARRRGGGDGARLARALRAPPLRGAPVGHPRGGGLPRPEGITASRSCAPAHRGGGRHHGHAGSSTRTCSASTTSCRASRHPRSHAWAPSPPSTSTWRASTERAVPSAAAGDKRLAGGQAAAGGAPARGEQIGPPRRRLHAVHLRRMMGAGASCTRWRSAWSPRWCSAPGCGSRW